MEAAPVTHYIVVCVGPRVGMEVKIEKNEGIPVTGRGGP
jgi:hypothetical protein